MDLASGWVQVRYSVRWTIGNEPRISQGIQPGTESGYGSPGVRARRHSIAGVSDLHGQVLPRTPTAIVTAPYPVDSLDVVGILCKLDELVGFDLPHGVVRAGGYNSIKEAIQHLMPLIEKLWLKRNGGAA